MIDTTHLPAPAPGVDPAIFDDLKERLRLLQDETRTARGEARRLARELAIARRLLKFHLGALPPARPAPATPDTGTTTVLLSEAVVYHLDACENLGAHTAISGWAFRPAPDWDASATIVTVLLRHEDTVYATSCHEVRRPDVAAFYARQPPGASGGASGLEGVGFACEVSHDALPADTEWKITLRLECGGRACEQFTGQFLRL